MKILFLSMEYPPETGGGGIGSYVAVQARALAAEGHDVHVLSCVRGMESRDYVDEGVLIHRRGQPTLRGVGRIARETVWRLHTAFAAFLEYRRLGLRFDVIEAPDWAAEGFLFALLRSGTLVAHLHSPLVFIYAGNGRRLGWDDRVASWMERTVVQRAHAVSAPSLFITRELQVSGWLARPDVHLIRHPIDLDRWASGSIDTPPRVLTVGRVEPRKAPEVVVEAAAELLEAVPELELVFLGRSNYLHQGRAYREYVSELAQALGVSATFYDPIPRDQLVDSYRSARVVVLPSAYDNFPMAGLEAMAAGRPLVCSSDCGLAELVEGTKAGATFCPGDVGGVASALLPFLEDEGVAREAGQRARELVERECAPESVTSDRIAVYEAAIRKSMERA